VTGIVDQLISTQPAIHGDEEIGQERMTHGLSTPALRFLADTVRSGQRTLETGSGYSTIVFAAAGSDHTVVVPNEFEGQRIREYCATAGIDDSRVSFHFEPSERVLPGLAPDPLDVVLIDGSHSFPHTFIDWFYTAHRLNVGGYLLVDDVHLWTGRVLRDYLIEDPAWNRETEFLGRTVLFRKVAATDADVLWTDQPVVVRRSRLATQARVQQALSMLRNGQRDELAGLVRRALGRG
jgi:predicted O-methyltransferase YrrM